MNALRFGQVKPEHLLMLEKKEISNPVGDFEIGKALRIYPTNKQVNEHNDIVVKLVEDHKE